MSWCFLVQTLAATEQPGAQIGWNARAVVLDAQKEPALRIQGEMHFPVRPLAGIVQQIADEFQRVLSVQRNACIIASNVQPDPLAGMDRICSPNDSVNVLSSIASISWRNRLRGVLMACARLPSAVRERRMRS